MSVQWITSGNPDAPSRTTTTFVTINGSGDNGFLTTEAAPNLIVPTAGFFRRISVGISVAPGVGKSWTFTVRKNGADTACTVTISGTNRFGVGALYTSQYSGGDLISLKCVPAGTPAAMVCSWGVEWVPVAHNEMIMMASTGNGNLTNGAYIPVNSVMTNGSLTEAYTTMKSPLDVCDVTKMYVALSSTPAALASRTFSFRNTGSTTTMAVTVAAGSTTGSNLIDVNSFIQNDEISTVSSVLGVPGSTTAKISYCYMPVVYPGEFFLSMNSADSAGTATAYAYLSEGNELWTATSADRQHYLNGNFMLTRLIAKLQLAPGVGSSRTFKVLRNGSDVGFNTTISGLSTSGTYNGPLTFTGSNSNCQVQHTVSGTPVATRMSFALRGIYLPPIPTDSEEAIING